MNLDSAVARAESVTGDTAAAKLYADTEFELALGDPTDEQERQGEEALQILERRFDGIKQRANDVVAHGGPNGESHTPRLSRAASEKAFDRAPEPPRAHEGRTRAGAKDGGAPHGGRQRPRVRPEARQAVSQRRQTRGGPGISDVVGFDSGDVTDTILTFLRWGFLIGIAYNVLTPRGSGALSRILGSGTSIIDAIVKPVDPLGARAGAAAGAPGKLSSIGGGDFGNPPNLGTQHPGTQHLTTTYSGLVAHGGPPLRVAQPVHPTQLGVTK